MQPFNLAVKKSQHEDEGDRCVSHARISFFQLAAAEQHREGGAWLRAWGKPSCISCECFHLFFSDHFICATPHSLSLSVSAAIFDLADSFSILSPCTRPENEWLPVTLYKLNDSLCNVKSHAPSLPLAHNHQPPAPHISRGTRHHVRPVTSQHWSKRTKENTRNKREKI